MQGDEGECGPLQPDNASTCMVFVALMRVTKKFKQTESNKDTNYPVREVPSFRSRIECEAAGWPPVEFEWGPQSYVTKSLFF